MGRPLSVTVFCGGRGSSSILRDLVRRHDVELTLVINAYDDGLSTGALRRLIPGMLGPSDFRKNLAHLLALHSRQQFDLVRIIEHRLPAGFSSADLDRLVAFLAGRRRSPKAEMAPLFAGLEPRLLARLGAYLAAFRDYRAAHDPTFSLDDCALGNLLFAGAYLVNGRRFNAAVRDLTAAMGCHARLVNVTGGENRVLVGLKEDGEILASEAAIVGPQSAARIAGIYLLDEPLAADEIRALAPLSFEEKRRRLEAREVPAHLSPEAREAIEGADILVYGPGTQHSSLLPSYKTIGVREAIARSRARVKALVVNLRADHDIQALGAADVAALALSALGDPENERGSITHVLAGARPDGAGPYPGGARPEGGRFRGAAWIEDRFENEASPGIHNGHRTVSTLLALFRRTLGEERETLELFVDLRERAPAAPLVVQELSELDWGRRFSRVHLVLNGAPLPEVHLPAPLSMAAADRGAVFSEVEAFRAWLERGTSDYLVTLAGDGEYRLSDVLVAVEVLQSGPFGAVFGSRNQSRRQMAGSLAYAYGESKTLYWGSWLGAYVFSGLFALRYRHLSSDPFTAFRVYRRSALEGVRVTGAIATGADVSKLLLGAGIEIAEIPIYYRTFKGFTNVRTRLSRGLRNAIASFT